MTIWTMGINQSTHGSDGVVAINNLNLITGNIGKPGGTSLSITGQCNAMGTREWSSCSGLPGYRFLENEKDRRRDRRFLGRRSGILPGAARAVHDRHLARHRDRAYQGSVAHRDQPDDLDARHARIRKTLEKLEFLVVQDAYRDVETNEYSHVYLPAAVWAEKEGCSPTPSGA